MYGVKASLGNVVEWSECWLVAELQQVWQDPVPGPRARQWRMDRCNALPSEHLLEVFVLSSRCWMRGRGCWRSCPGTSRTSRRCSLCCSPVLPERRHHDSWRVDGHSRAPRMSQAGKVETAGARVFDKVACEQQHCWRKDTLDLQPKCQGNKKKRKSHCERKFC